MALRLTTLAIMSPLLLAATLASPPATAQSYGVAPPVATVPVTTSFLDLTEDDMEAEVRKVWGVRGTGMGLVQIPILFTNGSAGVSADVVAKLAKLANVLSRPQLQKARLSIEGHANATGSAAANQDLTERRANRVMQVLVQTYGIAPSRLEAKGFGFTSPRKDLDPTDAANRRVELRLIDAQQPTP